jgi:hypothetical protein
VSYNRSMQASFWLMIVVQTIGAVDMPGKGNRKLPAPRAYVLVVVLWASLGLLADSGRAQIASAAGWLVVLTGMVVGPFGGALTGLLSAVSKNFAVKPAPAAASTQATPPANQSV